MATFLQFLLVVVLAAASTAGGAYLGMTLQSPIGGGLGALGGFLLGVLLGSRLVSENVARGAAALIQDLGLGESLRKLEGGFSLLRFRGKHRQTLALLAGGTAAMKKENAHLEVTLKKFLGTEASRVATQLGGQSRGGVYAELTSVFVDLRGYTNLSERVPPEELIVLLNEYLTMVEERIVRYKGHVNKFIGDAVLAYFDPEPDGAGTINNDAERAVAACGEIVQEFRRLQRKWSRVLADDVRPGVGCGVATGRVFRGNIGTPHRVEYTLIGDGVNLSSRLCSQAQDGMVIASESTFEKSKRLYEAIEWPPVQIKGKAEPQRVFQIMNLRPGVSPVAPAAGSPAVSAA